MRDLAALGRCSMAHSGFRRACFMCPETMLRPKKSSRSRKWWDRSGACISRICETKRQRVLDSVRETIRIGEEGKTTDADHASQDHRSAAWGKSVRHCELIEEARSAGRRCVVGSVSVHGFAYRFGGDVSTVVARRWTQRAARAFASARVPGAHQGRSRAAYSAKIAGQAIPRTFSSIGAISIRR